MYRIQREVIPIFFFFKQKTAYEISACLVGSEMCIRDRRRVHGNYQNKMKQLLTIVFTAVLLISYAESRCMPGSTCSSNVDLYKGDAKVQGFIRQTIARITSCTNGPYGSNWQYRDLLSISTRSVPGINYYLRFSASTTQNNQPYNQIEVTVSANGNRGVSSCEVVSRSRV
eukprot:TRINITY_DN573_c0_g1_i12.p1 TRINITY_DN573_c0_g1~~TRINITY_DN573_c0_g1_i12.p1  ORF type:complete len:171 (+),score=30.22 TRINITY_DN573_c0_g1_i12:34-546(+)